MQEIIAAIGRIRRAMPRNVDAMLICDELELRLQLMPLPLDNPEAKATRGKAASRQHVAERDGVASRLRAGRTARDAASDGGVAIQKRGRPKLPADAPASKRTQYRRKAQGK